MLQEQVIGSGCSMPTREIVYERSAVDAGAGVSGRSDDDKVLSAAVVWLSLPQTDLSRCAPSPYPDLEQALLSPAAVFARPEDVVRHSLLSLTCKREILWRWAWDEYLVDLAQAEGMPEGPPSRLEEVRRALQMLGDEWSPGPAAPAMRLPIFQQGPIAQAA